MERVYKIFSLLIAFALLVSLGLINVYAASTETVKTISSVADFTFIDPIVEHEQIETVLAGGILNAKIFANFGEASAANAVLEYKLDSGEVVEVTKDAIPNKRAFYIGTEKGLITKDNSTIDYRIKVTFTTEDGDYILYAPVDASSETFVTAQVISVIEDTIDGSAGGTKKVFCGDQSKGDNGYVTVTVPAGAYSGAHQVTVNFLDDTDSSSQGSGSGSTRENIISTASVEVEGVSEISTPIQIKNLPLQTETTASKFTMQYENGMDWETATGANLSVDKTYQLYSFNAANLGSYRIIETVNLSNSSYRPDNRIVVKGKIGSTYPGFEFKYLREGDTVTIYNLKGRKIRKISASSGTTVWDGKKDNGDWAESGTYIYQIKLKSGGDVISGTLAFVW